MIGLLNADLSSGDEVRGLLLRAWSPTKLSVYHTTRKIIIIESTGVVRAAQVQASYMLPVPETGRVIIIIMAAPHQQILHSVDHECQIVLYSDSLASSKYSYRLLV